MTLGCTCQQPAPLHASRTVLSILLRQHPRLNLLLGAQNKLTSAGCLAHGEMESLTPCLRETASCTMCNAGANMQKATDARTGNYSAIDSDAVPFPKPSVYPYYSATQSGMCNVYIPNDSTLSR